VALNHDEWSLLVRIDERVASLIEGGADREARIRSLEKFRNWGTGVVAAVSSLFGYNLSN
jgi:hypothetical protein